jgi:hypothetical protein
MRRRERVQEFAGPSGARTEFREPDRSVNSFPLDLALAGVLKHVDEYKKHLQRFSADILAID